MGESWLWDCYYVAGHIDDRDKNSLQYYQEKKTIDMRNCGYFVLGDIVNNQRPIFWRPILWHWNHRDPYSVWKCSHLYA